MNLGWILRFPYIVTECNVAHEDLEYILSLLGYLSTLGPIDDRRTFAVGHSSGGFFTLTLGNGSHEQATTRYRHRS